MSLPKCFVIDTNCLIYDPNAIEVLMNDVNEVYIHTVVIQELDNLKTSRDIGRDAREAIRNIDKLHIEKHPRFHIVQYSNWSDMRLNHLDKNKNDHNIIALAYNLMGENDKVVLISKDITVRILARDLGIVVEDYIAESIKIDDTKLKEVEVPYSNIDKLGNEYIFRLPDMSGFVENEGAIVWSDWNGCLSPESNTNWKQNFAAIKKGDKFHIIPNDISMMGLAPYMMNGSGKNWEQYVAMAQLMDDSIRCVFLIGGAGSGKAQPMDAKVLTPTGWTTMGEIHPGDEILTPYGCKTNVVSTHPQGEIDVYKVVFSDGSSTECCDDHLWFTRTCYESKMGYYGSVKTLKQIRDTLVKGNSKRRNHTIPMVSNISFNRVDVPIDPYLLGIILGDGCISGTGTPSISTIDDEIINNLNTILLPEGMVLGDKSGACTYYIKHIDKPSWDAGGNKLRNKLSSLGLTTKKSETKFIPNIYKYNSIDVRISILQGLLDTDGTIGKNNNISYTTSSKLLMMDVREIVMSLGGKAVVRSRFPNYMYNGEQRVGKLSYTLHISLPNGINPFRLSRKMARVKNKDKYPPIRLIDSVEYIGKKECQCIYVDSPDHLYVTDDYIVTHNTMLGLAAALEQRRKFRNIVITRPMIALENENNMGFLPGDINDKMGPWLKPIYRTMSQISYINEDNKKIIEKVKETNKVEIQPLDYVRGLTFVRDILVCDEMQNCSQHAMRTLITRAGEGTKMIFTGDLAQIDMVNKLNAETSGLAYASAKMSNQKMVATTHFKKTVRSELAYLAEKLLR